MLDIEINPVAAAPAAQQAPQDPQAAASPMDLGPEPSDADVDTITANPVVKPVLAGVIPAVRFDRESQAPEIQQLVSMGKMVMQLGVSAYKAQSGEIVLFNQKVKGEDLQKADKEGRLQEIVPPADEFLGGAAPAAAAAPTPQVAAPALPSKTANRIGKARLDQLLNNETPTEKPMPAGGRLNELLNRAI